MATRNESAAAREARRQAFAQWRETQKRDTDHDFPELCECIADALKHNTNRDPKKTKADALRSLGLLECLESDPSVFSFNDLPEAFKTAVIDAPAFNLLSLNEDGQRVAKTQEYAARTKIGAGLVPIADNSSQLGVSWRSNGQKKYVVFAPLRESENAAAKKHYRRAYELLNALPVNLLDELKAFAAKGSK